MSLNVPSRVLHDVGLAAWFGGTLANAVALNPASGYADEPQSTGQVANVGWDAWTPVNATAIGAHVVGALGQLRGNKTRLARQQGVVSMAVLKTALTATALGVTAYSRVLGKRVSAHHRVPAASATEPVPSTPPDVAAAQNQLKALQWVIPAITGALIAVSAFAGEQQRSQALAGGVLRRFTPGL